MHLLLVEDNEHDIFFVREALKRLEQQIELSVVTDGAQALDFLFRRAPYTQAGQPHIMLLDLNLPRKSGVEVLTALKQDPHLKCIPTIILTSSDNPQEVTRCYELGANAYLVKPLGLHKLYDVMKTVVEFWSACEFRLLAQRN